MKSLCVLLLLVSACEPMDYRHRDAVRDVASMHCEEFANRCGHDIDAQKCAAHFEAQWCDGTAVGPIDCEAPFNSDADEEALQQCAEDLQELSCDSLQLNPALEYGAIVPRSCLHALFPGEGWGSL